ncbi:MAG: glutamate formimidoyltransferase [Acholeplasmataceae bacterium]
MNRIVQCVPNLSEGRDRAKIERIVAPLKDGKGFKLVRVEPDQDYNRTVITLLGDPESMIGPLEAFFERAKQEIDMKKHQGEHPRMGAIDVVPFIPIAGVRITDCVEYAARLAEGVGKKLGIPVFLYAEAARQKNRVSLPRIRKGEFEGMKEKIKDEQWKPDFGPWERHETFGTTAIGARIPLIAYNIDLNTADEKLAASLARAIRKSSGGFQYIQAGPAYLEEREHVQVTMNILDYKKNPLYRIFETVRMEAKRYQVEIMSSEVVGLIPLDALKRSLAYYLSVEGEKLADTISLDDVVVLARKYLLIRDFSREKIIEANL